MRGGRYWFAILLVFLVAMLGLVAPVVAQEATGPAIDQLEVDLWPQYDDLRLLVIYRVSLAAPPDQPVRFPIPAGAEVNAVAHLTDDGRLISEQWNSEPAGDQQVITFTPATANFQLEYYLDVIGSAPERSFTVNIDVDGQPVSLLEISVQEPVGASNLTGEPALSGPQAGFEGLNYFSRRVDGVQPGQVVQQAVTYTKTDSALSEPQIQPQESGPTGSQSQPATSSGSGFSTNLSGRSLRAFWLPVGAVIVIIAGLSLIGVGAWRSWREEAESGRVTVARKQNAERTRSRRTRGGSRAASAEPSTPELSRDGPAKFCHNCGAAFGPDDRFCAECGAPRRGV